MEPVKVHNTHVLYEYGDTTVFYSKFVQELVDSTNMLVCTECRDYDYHLEQPCRGKEFK